MSTACPDAIVVGAGVVGLATARAIARSGRSVTLLEQHVVGHTEGSSHGTSRIFRLGYRDTRFVQLAREARALWAELEDEAGITLVHTVGSLDIGAIAAQHAAALSACGVPFELLDGAVAELRWPLAFAPDEPVLYQADGGVTYADRALVALRDSALTAGAVIEEHTCVREIRVRPGCVEIDTDEGTRTGRSVVVTAGAWARSLLARTGIELPVTPTLETVSYFEIPGADELPTVVDSRVPGDPGAYGITRCGDASYALHAPGIGLKAGIHHAGTEAMPGERASPADCVARWTSEWVGYRYPEANPAPSAVETCLYTNTSDESFLLERHDRVIVGSACSGHGFKHAPTTGLALARLVAEVVA
jgi:sarcosine oxidase